MRGQKLSVVVPAYNEEAYIHQCLEKLISDINDIDEIVVVDNNSSDRTFEIVESYARKHAEIRVLTESNQGIAFARDCGFNAASGDIIARIDADTRVQAGWASSIKSFYSRSDTIRVGAVTGLNNSYDSPYRILKKFAINLQVTLGILGNENRLANLHGANMAIRADAWKQIKNNTSNAPGLHEDLDLALCLVREGYEIAQLDQMKVDVSPRRAYTPPWEFNKHVKATFATIERHGLDGKQLRLAVFAHWLAHAGVWLAYRPYDPVEQRFSVRKALCGGSKRFLAVG